MHNSGYLFGFFIFVVIATTVVLVLREFDK